LFWFFLLKDEALEAGPYVKSKAQWRSLMTNVSDQIESAKSTITSPLPTPPDLSGKQASPNELLSRLNWGEPGLTIVDVRGREAFNNERITGAVPMPIGQIPDSAEPLLEYERDLYIYGDSTESTTEAANQFRQAGFKSVAELEGGLEAWKKIGGPTEGVYAFSSPAKSAEQSS
jgi:rhodanese-related sulfurtransferase